MPVVSKGFKISEDMRCPGCRFHCRVKLLTAEYTACSETGVLCKETSVLIYAFCHFSFGLFGGVTNFIHATAYLTFLTLLATMLALAFLAKADGYSVDVFSQ